MAVTFTRNQLFDLITSQKGWYNEKEGHPQYCTANLANVMINRHKSGQLSQEAYDKLFFHYGYQKQTIYVKN